MSECSFQWKMQFNPDPSKQAYQVYFPRKPNRDDYLVIKQNDSPVQLCKLQKHFRGYLRQSSKFP